MKKLIFFLLNASAVLVIKSAHADVESFTGELPEITVTAPIIVKPTNTHYDTAVGTSDAASEGTVLGAIIQDQPLLRPGDVLEDVPGVVVTQHSGDGKANQYFLRGYNLDHGTDFASQIDGVPVNMPTNAHGQGYSDLNYLIPELVQTIQYHKGPYFAEDGDFSSAGSAHVQYRNSLDHNIADFTVGEYGYQRTLLAGSRQFSTTSSEAEKNGPTVLGAIDFMHNDGPWTFPEHIDKVNGLVRFSEGSQANGWSIETNFYQASWNSTDQIPLALIDSGQLGRYSALDPTDGGDTGRNILSGEWHSNDDKGYSTVSGYVEHYRLQLWSDFTFYELRSAVAPNPNLPSDQFEQVESRNVYGAQAAKGWLHGLLGRDSTTEVGVQVRHDNINVGLLDTQSRMAFATVSNDQVSETETAAYVQNTTHWTQWMRTIVGLREEYLAMDLNSYVLPQNSGNASGSKPLPKFSAIFGPWKKTEYFINTGKGFHSNDARGVIDKVDPTTGTLASAVPALVGSTGKEIGVRTEIVPGLQSSVALWSLDSDSELVYNADSDIGSTSPNGASKRTGVEWSNHMICSQWLLLDADLAWTHARYATMNDNGQIGDMIPNAVSKVALLRATLRNFGLWSVGLETRYIGAYPLSQDGSLTAPSAIITNVRVQRRMTHNLTLSMDVLNLFNRQYYDIAYEQDYRVSPTSAVVPNGITVHPGEPIQLRATLRLSF